MIGYRPHPSKSGGGTAYDDAEIKQDLADEVVRNDVQTTDIAGLKSADLATDARDTAIETKNASQDVVLGDHGTRLTAGEAKDTAQDLVDTGLAGRATALETKATANESKDQAQDTTLAAHAGRLKSGEDYDATQDAQLVGALERVRSVEGRAAALESKTGAGSGGSIVRSYTNDLRQTAAVTDFNIASHAAPGDTHFRLRLFAGGASGCGRASSTAVAHGGECGEEYETIWLPIAEYSRFSSLIGLGGAAVTGKTGNNPGNPTSVTLTKTDGSTVPLFARGGFGTDSAPYQTSIAMLLGLLIAGNSLPGCGRYAVGVAGVFCNAQTVRNRAGSGGGSHIGSDANLQLYTPGNGADVVYPEGARHGLTRVPGGLGARPVASEIVSGGDGQNPLPTVTGTKGSGGGGTVNGQGGAGGFPSGGGGGTGNLAAASGKGANGCLDVEFGKQG